MDMLFLLSQGFICPCDYDIVLLLATLNVLLKTCHRRTQAPRNHGFLVHVLLRLRRKLTTSSQKRRRPALPRSEQRLPCLQVILICYCVWWCSRAVWFDISQRIHSRQVRRLLAGKQTRIEDEQLGLGEKSLLADLLALSSQQDLVARLDASMLGDPSPQAVEARDSGVEGETLAGVPDEQLY